MVKEGFILQDPVHSPPCFLQLSISSHTGPPTVRKDHWFGLILYLSETRCRTHLSHHFSHKPSTDLYPSSDLSATLTTLQSYISLNCSTLTLHQSLALSLPFYISTSVTALLSPEQTLVSLLPSHDTTYPDRDPLPPLLPHACSFFPKTSPMSWGTYWPTCPSPLTNSNSFMEQLPNTAQQCCWAAQQLQSHHQPLSTTTFPLWGQHLSSAGLLSTPSLSPCAIALLLLEGHWIGMLDNCVRNINACLRNIKPFICTSGIRF